ncbi:MAG: SDR family oxidoreductase [Thermoanaerobaculales bacterium]|nr:SDR family oxidoreductase [Thermoanaerobaculales bacterium]
MVFPENNWALILGGSSGFGLATAHKLARHGMNLAILHRDRRGAMKRIEPEFESMRALGVQVRAFNSDALSSDIRSRVLDEVHDAMGCDGRIKVVLHSIAFGNLKLAVKEFQADHSAVTALAEQLQLKQSELQATIDELLAEGHDAYQLLSTSTRFSESLFLEEEDLARTIHAMGTSLLGWVQEIFNRGIFADDARVFGLTSEGNTVAWKGYAAVAAAKVALESIARSIAVEFGPYGIRCNVLQAGVTDTPALRLIHNYDKLMADAKSRNPFGRLTVPDDVANMVYLLSLDEAAWVNGDVIRIDGGEHVSGVRR